MQDKVYRCSFIINSMVGGSPTSYSDDNILVHVKNVDGCSGRQLAHTHTFFEFDIVIAGEGINRSAKGETVIRPGDVIFGTPASIHSITTCEDTGMVVANIAFKGKFEQSVIQAFNTLEGFILRLSEKEFEFVCSEIDGMIGCDILDTSKKKRFVKGSAEKIIAVISDAYERSNIGEKTAGTDSKVYSAIIYIMKNYNKPIKIADVARHVGYSEDHLGVLLKKSTRMTFTSYLLTLRLENAFFLHMENELNIGEICNEVGYSSYPNFYNAFKKRFGIAPGEIARRSRRENLECFVKNNGQKPLIYDENNTIIWR